MKQIPLTKGQFALVDDEDFDRLTAMGSWCINSHGYAVRSKGYKKPDGRRGCITIFMHRVIMNTPAGMDTDHGDTDRLNNQKYNLRVCTRSQNKMNTKKRAGNKSGFKGVSWNKQRSKWESYISVNSKKKNLGLFNHKADAAIAYNKAAI